MKRKIAVVGAGLSGLRAAEQLRAAGWDEHICVIGDEPHQPYNRPPLTKTALRDGADPAGLAFRQRSSTADVEWRLGTTVTSADLAARRLTLDDGSTLDHDGLVIASGVSSRRLQLDAPAAWRYSIRSPEDANALHPELVPDARVVVIGAGFIGCEVADTARTLGCDVSVVEPFDTPLEGPMGTVLGGEIQRRHEARGVRFHTGRTVRALERDEGSDETVLLLDEGSRLVADVVVEAVGSVPNVGWLAGQGLDLTNGVLCDEDLHPITAEGALLDVVALGDVARFPLDRFGFESFRIEHWNMPGETAAHAARSLVAGLSQLRPTDHPFHPLPTFWSDQLGSRIQAFGIPALGRDDVRVLEGDLSDEVVLGYHRDDRLVGVVLVGMAKRMLDYRTAVLEANPAPVPNNTHSRGGPMSIDPDPTTTTTKPVQELERVVIRFAGDSGDGMQLTGDQFTQEAALFGNDLSTLPNFPAEIRAPQGTLPGVSSFQVHFANYDILTPGDKPDVLVAMNPAALRGNVGDVRTGGTIIVDTHDFTTRNLAKAGYTDNPLETGDLDHYEVHAIDLTGTTVEAVKEFGLSRKDAARSKNMFALGLISWMYGRSVDGIVDHLEAKFATKPQIRDANVTALRSGWYFGETTETFAVQYEVKPATTPPGTYRNITGNTALSYGLVAAGNRSGLPVFLGAYPITPASDILHELSKHKRLGVTTFQAEDEIAAIGAAVGASYGGSLGVTTTSGPGLSLKGEALGLAVMLELPLVVVDVQRGGPSTGLPTKTEQADLLQAMFGRNGEAPLPVIAPQSPSDCFEAAIEAARIAITYRTPVLLLSDGYLANGSEPWQIPELSSIARIEPDFATGPNHTDGDEEKTFLPYQRDAQTLARPWAVPGTAGLEHRIGGLEKADGTGDISYDAANHDFMVRTRQAKVDRVVDMVPDIEVDDPSGRARTLVIGWGSTYGPIGAGVRRVRNAGRDIAQAHLRHLNPFPANLGEVLGAYDQVIVPEMNLGQLSMLLRARYLVPARRHTNVRGMPFGAEELFHAFLSYLDEESNR